MLYKSDLNPHVQMMPREQESDIHQLVAMQLAALMGQDDHKPLDVGAGITILLALGELLRRTEKTGEIPLMTGFDPPSNLGM